jgi:hypothetical protein
MADDYREKLEDEFRERVSDALKDHDERIRYLEISNGKILGIGIVVAILLPIVVTFLMNKFLP